MRLPAYAAFLLFGLALAGCGRSDERTWEVDNLVDVDNSTLVSEFNAYADSVDERWEHSPILVVAEMLRLDTSDHLNVTIVSKAPPEGTAEAKVVITYTRLLDDSVEAIRSAVTLGRNGEIWRVRKLASSSRCQPGRGHQDFSPERCV